MFHHKREVTHIQKNVSHKEGVTHPKGVHILYLQKEGTHTLLSCVYQARDHYSIAEVIEEGESSNFIDDLTKMQSTEFTCPQRRNELWQTKSKQSLRTSLPEECVVQVVKEDGNMNCSQDNLRLEKTRSNTPKYMDHKNSDVSSMPRETERILQDVDL